MSKVPAAPEFGAPTPLPARSDAVLALLASRRSCAPVTLNAPAPQGEELDGLLRLGARVPDHGKLTPFRFIIVQGDAKADLVRRLEPLAHEQAEAKKAAGVLKKLSQPPLAVIVVSCPVQDKIAEWEQVLCSGAVCTSLVIAAGAMGYGANWITDWYSYDERGRTVMGLLPGERVAGVVLIGTPSEAPLERARPDVAAITTVWAAP